MESAWLSSKEILLKTSISRATLNNYIKLGLLPRPVVKSPETDLGGTKKIGYFPKTAVERIERIQTLKREGHSMEAIAKRYQDSPLVLHEARRPAPEGPETRRASSVHFPEPAHPRTPAGSPINRTIDDIGSCAYLVNPNFEVEWLNEAAEQDLFNRRVGTVSEAEGRNIFKLFFSWEFHDAVRNWEEVAAFHMAFAKAKIERSAISRLYRGITDSERNVLEKIYDEQVAFPDTGFDDSPLTIRKKDGTEVTYVVHTVFFREGMFFVYDRDDGARHAIHSLLSRREKVIGQLLRRRMPSLVSLCVVVADLQDSVKISAELPPSEYFELINGLWRRLSGTFDKYHAVCGKHAGDGMLYYFIKKPGTNYLIDAIRCSVEVRRLVRAFSDEWKRRKGWLNDLFLNIGINEGKEFFGTIQSAASMEFAALGDSINYTGRLSDLARYGAILTTKNVINKLTPEELDTIRFGVHRKEWDREIFVERSFSRVVDMLDPGDPKHQKFMDIATLPVTEIAELIGEPDPRS